MNELRALVDKLVSPPMTMEAYGLAGHVVLHEM